MSLTEHLFLFGITYINVSLYPHISDREKGDINKYFKNFNNQDFASN